MSLYLDGSIVAKLLVAEPDSARVLELLRAESEIVISALARLEALIVIDAMVAGGESNAQAATRRRVQLDELQRTPGFRFQPCGAGLFHTAEAQLPTAYCRTLDRLHLAAMQEYGLRRIVTNDDQQAAAARALGFEVLMPR